MHSEPAPTLDARGLLAALHGGLAQLERNADLLDALNVFPVPDGDTGSNMVHTLRAGLVGHGSLPQASLPQATLPPQPDTLPALAETLRPRLLAESRGNSGFLVATFLDGFLRDLAELPQDPRADTVDAARLAHAFEAGAYHATTALANPREGTMLTAMRVMSESLRAAPFTSISDALTRAVAAGRDAVADTPRLLPVLRRAGVVDAGALGLVLLFDGLRRAVQGEAPAVEDGAPHRFPPAADVPAEPMHFRYCTEVVAGNPRGLPTAELRAYLAGAGDSLAILETDGLIKLHVHTNAPAEVIARAASFGAIVREKVEDMQAQVEAAALAGGARTSVTGETGDIGVLAIVPGPGFIELFLGLGAAHCLVTLDQLPSTADIAAALAEITAPRLLILANNNNITPAASLAAKQDPRPADVVPTGDVTAGTAAMYCFNASAPLAETLAAMRTGAGLAIGLGVCRAPRAATYGDRSIAAGECFAIRGEHLLAVAAEPAPALLAALAALGLAGRSVVTLHRGRDLDQDTHEAVAEAVRAAWPALQVEPADGGQSRYLLWVSIE